MIVILGPTAVGKTQLSIDLAKRLNTEIISGDSMLLYQGMDIGTAKPTNEEQQGIRHHLIDILDPHEDFTVVQFQEEAGQKIRQLNRQGKIPVLAGGTGLYVKALLEGYTFNPTPDNAGLRCHLEELSARYGNAFLHQRLAAVAPATAKRLHPNDQRRIIRALEVYYLTGTTIQETQTAPAAQLQYDAVVIGLTMERSQLYARINQRVDLMLEQGLLAETRRLLADGVPLTAQAMQAIGYKEIVEHLTGEISLSDAVDNLKQATRHFAKRQLTWYRKMPYIDWYDVQSFPSYTVMLETIYRHIAGKYALKVE